MLGVHWSAHQEEIDEAWSHQKFTLDPAHYPDTLSDEDAARRAELDTSLDKAYDVLSDPKSRRIYRSGMIDTMNLKSAVALYWEKGDTCIIRNEPEEARNFLLRVLELMPEHSGAKTKLIAADTAIASRK